MNKQNVLTLARWWEQSDLGQVALYNFFGKAYQHSYCIWDRIATGTVGEDLSDFEEYGIIPPYVADYILEVVYPQLTVINTRHIVKHKTF